MPEAKNFPALLEQHKNQIALALPKHINADRMARIALTCFRMNPQLGEAEPMSVFAAVIQAAQLGLEPGLNGRAYILPYKNRRTNKTEAQFIPGWKGLLELANRSGRASAWTDAVYQGDAFEWEKGTSPFVRHAPKGEMDPAKLTHAYAVGRIKGADFPVIEVWSKDRIMKHRDRNNKVGDSHYSYKHPEMYARKVVLLQVLKYLPATPELEAAIVLNDAAETNAQHLNLGDVLEGTFIPQPDEIHEHEGMKAAKSVKELAELFTALSAEDKKAFKTYYDIRHDELSQAA